MSTVAAFHLEATKDI